MAQKIEKEIMDALLATLPNVEQMSANELADFKRNLVKNFVYMHFARKYKAERNKAAVEELKSSASELKETVKKTVRKGKK